MLVFWIPMPALDTQDTQARPRVGIPWRTSQEEWEKNRRKLDYYFQEVVRAGAQPVEISLAHSEEQLQKEFLKLDAFVLPGSPADVNPALYHTSRHEKTHDPD